MSRRADVVNAAAVVLALGLAVAGPLLLRPGRVVEPPAKGYHRIISLSVVGDALLLDLAGRDRLIAVSEDDAGVARSRFGDLPRLSPNIDANLERVLDLKPDLVVLSSFGGASPAAQRLRDAGVEVLVLADSRGLATLHQDAATIGRVLGADARAAELMSEFDERLKAIAADVPPARQRRAIMLSIGTTLYGGTVGTSYHDLIVAAGLRDAAAEAGWRDWPTWSVEDVLALDPDVLIVSEGTAASLRSHPSLARLRAVQATDGIIELPEAALADPGLGLLPTAALLHQLAYPPGR